MGCVPRVPVARRLCDSDASLSRDITARIEPSVELQSTLIELYRRDPKHAGMCERLVDLDEGLQEWRYRHVKMVQRTIGAKAGTGGSTGAQYLATTLMTPIFPDLWEIEQGSRFRVPWFRFQLVLVLVRRKRPRLRRIEVSKFFAHPDAPIFTGIPFLGRFSVCFSSSAWLGGKTSGKSSHGSVPRL